MIKSMTGFGRCELVSEERRITVEIKAVNHRYLETNIRIPKKLNFFDSAIRSFLKQYIQRGKVDVFVSYEDYMERKSTLHYHREVAAEYVEDIRQMAKDFGLEDDLTAARLARFPDVFTMEESSVDEQKLWEHLQKALEKACGHLVEARSREGQSLCQDLTKKLGNISRLVEAVEERSPQILEEYRGKLTAKAQELLGDTQMIEEGRLAAEIVFFADKICTDEEAVRLKSHVDSMANALKQGEGIGRKLDFIAQEMNREANTILSKANDLTVSQIAIDLKTEIEKVREQIQNIE